MLLPFPKEVIQPIADLYLPYLHSRLSLQIYFAFSGNKYLSSTLDDPSIVPDLEFVLELKGKIYELKINTEKLAKGWHKGKPTVPMQEPGPNSRIAVAWIDCPDNPPPPFRCEAKRKNWEFLVE